MVTYYLYVKYVFHLLPLLYYSPNLDEVLWKGSGNIAHGVSSIGPSIASSDKLVGSKPIEGVPSCLKGTKSPTRRRRYFSRLGNLPMLVVMSKLSKQACFEVILPPTSGSCQQQLTSSLENFTLHSNSAQSRKISWSSKIRQDQSRDPESSRKHAR